MPGGQGGAPRLPGEAEARGVLGQKGEPLKASARPAAGVRWPTSRPRREAPVNGHSGHSGAGRVRLRNTETRNQVLASGWRQGRDTQGVRADNPRGSQRHEEGVRTRGERVLAEEASGGEGRQAGRLLSRL